MTLTIFKGYAILNVLLVFLSILLFVMNLFHKKWKFSDQLRFAYALLLALFGLPFLCFFSKPMKVISPSSQEFLGKFGTYSQHASQEVQRSSLLANNLSLNTSLLFAVTCLVFLIVLIRTVLEIRKLYTILNTAFAIKKYRTVRVLISDAVTVPFSFWFPFRSYIVLPEFLVVDTEKQRLALAHEIQHHRQGDTKSVYAIQLLKLLCFWNPFVYLLEWKLSQVQEFACDEALLGQRGFSSLAYCRCLLWVAEHSLQSTRQLIGTLSMMREPAKNLLKRRIEHMLAPKLKRQNRSVLAAIGTLSIVGMLGLAFAANASIRDRNVSLERANQMLEIAHANSDFPVVVNERVLEQLNHFLGTPEGRDYIQNSLAQMKNHEEMVSSTIHRYQFPKELAAIPIVESAYKNLPQSHNPAHGAGIWQFIPSTARNFGLKVDASKDQRLNVELETDAAMRLLGALYLQFQGWGLALLAFNGGAELVQRGIEETGSRDVWFLLSHGYEGDAAYIAKVMAAILLIGNPSLLD